MTDPRTNVSALRRRAVLLLAFLIALTVSTRLRADTGSCGGASITLPFTDVPVTGEIGTFPQGGTA